MIDYKVEKIEQKTAVSVTCSVCGETFDWKQDEMEVQEFLHIRFRGGYESVFGDGVLFEADICQHCLKERLGDVITVDEENPWEE